jgi:hypothetical protein
MAATPSPAVRLAPNLELEYNGLKIELYHHESSVPTTRWRGRLLREAAYWEQVVICPDGYILSDTNDHRLRSGALKAAKEIVDEYLADPSLYRDDLPGSGVEAASVS